MRAITSVWLKLEKDIKKLLMMHLMLLNIIRLLFQNVMESHTATSPILPIGL